MVEPRLQNPGLVLTENTQALGGPSFLASTLILLQLAANPYQIFLQANFRPSQPDFRARLSDAKSSLLLRGIHTAACFAAQPRDWSDINGSVAGQPVLWDSLETLDRVAKLAPRGELLTGDAGSEGHFTMLWNVSEGLAQDKAGLNFTKGHS